MKILKNNKGFTLIELLVVVSIIGLLASVILTSVNSARDKVRYSKYIQGMEEFSKLMELEYSNTGSYYGLTTNLAGPTNAPWLGIGGAADCDAEYGPASGRTSVYLANANAICKSILSASLSAQNYVLMVVNTTGPDRYSIQGWFDAGHLNCFGSSGKSFKVLWANGVNYNSLGCSNNP